MKNEKGSMENTDTGNNTTAALLVMAEEGRAATQLSKPVMTLTSIQNTTEYPIENNLTSSRKAIMLCRPPNSSITTTILSCDSICSRPHTALFDRTVVISASTSHVSADDLQDFDGIVLINSGELIYHGPLNQVRAYFEELGFSCPPTQDFTAFLLALGTDDQTQFEVMNSRTFGHHPRQPHEFAAIFRESDLYIALVHSLDVAFAMEQGVGDDNCDDDDDADSQSQPDVAKSGNQKQHHFQMKKILDNDVLTWTRLRQRMVAPTFMAAVLIGAFYTTNAPMF